MAKAQAKAFVEFQRVQKSYDGEVLVVKDLNLAIPRGEFLTMLGPSGSGKTTLLNILGLIDSFDFGNLKYLGNDVTLVSEAERDKLRLNHLGFVYQSNNLFDDFSAVENVALPLLLLGNSKNESNKKSIDFLNKRLDKTKGKATKTRSSLEKKLNALEKAAKDLGRLIDEADGDSKNSD